MFLNSETNVFTAVTAAELFWVTRSISTRLHVEKRSTSFNMDFFCRASIASIASGDEKASFSLNATGAVLWFNPNNTISSNFYFITCMKSPWCISSREFTPKKVNNTIINPIIAIIAALLPRHPTVKR